MKNAVQIIYEDDVMIIVNKPSDLLTIPDRFDSSKPNLYHILSNLYNEKIYVVHRIDRETSGILCFARTEEAHRHLSQQFEERSVEKVYWALVDGKPNPPEGLIDKPIGAHPTLAGKMTILRNGKSAVTTYRALEVFKSFTLIEARIQTGRTHQIRVHLKSIGHPLAVDALYGRRNAFFLSEVKLRQYHTGKYQEEERPLMSRNTLHAQQLTLTHPTTGVRLSFEAPLPKDFQAVLQQLRKWGSPST